MPLTKNEIRHSLREDEVFQWLKDILTQKFNEEILLLGANSSDRLWEIKGISQVMHYIRDPEILLDFIDDEDFEK